MMPAGNQTSEKEVHGSCVGQASIIVNIHQDFVVLPVSAGLKDCGRDANENAGGHRATAKAM